MCAPGVVRVGPAYVFGVVMVEAVRCGELVVACGTSDGVVSVVVRVGGLVQSGVMNAVVGVLIRVGE